MNKEIPIANPGDANQNETPTIGVDIDGDSWRQGCEPGTWRLGHRVLSTEELTEKFGPITWQTSKEVGSG